MPSSAIVHVIDDDPAMRSALQCLAESSGLTVATYASALDFLEHCDFSQPGCIVADLRMPGMSGIQLLETLAERDAGMPVILISAHGSIPVVVRAMQRGALDFFEKPFEPQRVLDRIHDAIQHAERAHAAGAERRRAAERLTRLTAREREVLELLAAGHPTKTVALKLGLSAKTVHTHRAQVFRKLEVESLVDLAWLTARAQGLRDTVQQIKPKTDIPSATTS